MTVVVKPSLAGLAASLMTRDGTYSTSLFYMLCGVTTAPWTVFDTTPSTSYPGLMSDIREAGLEIATGGGYVAGSLYDVGTGHVHFDAGAQVLEIALPTGPTWTGSDLFTVSFRYIVIGGWSEWTADPAVISIIDTGTTSSLSAAPLSITAVVSATFPGTYPIARWTA